MPEVMLSGDLGLFTPNYDVEESEMEGYLEWLHGEHLPRTLAEGSFSAISHYEAIEAPKRFQLLEVMPAYTNFHSQGRLDAAKGLPADVADKMALRLGQVRCHYAGVSRVNGPSDSARGAGLAIGPAVYLLRFEVEAGARPDFNAWLAREHFAEAARIEGLLSFRRYLAVEGEPANLFLYEFESTEALQAGGVEQAWSTPWAGKVSASMAHGEFSKVSYRRIWCQG